MELLRGKQTSPNIPFSWEMIPGVPKFMASPAADKEVIGQKDDLAPLPPPPPPPPGCFREPIMRRSVSLSRMIFWREEDPFLAAFKECSKDNYKVKGDHQMKKRFGIGNKVSFLWCRCSFDVEDGNLRTRPLPAACGGSPVIPRERVQGLIRMHKGSRK